MLDIQIDFEQFYQEFGIKISNPIYKGKDLSIRHKIMIAMREHYLKHRNFYRKIFPENASEEFMFNSDDSFISSSDRTNCSAEQQIDIDTGEAILPYYNLESIQVVDILPKEFIPEFRMAIRDVVRKNQKTGFGFNCVEEASLNEYKKIHNSYFHFCVASFPVKSDSKFGQFASGIEIRMISLSSSFVGIVCKFYLNDRWIEKINNLCVNDRTKHTFYSGMERLKIWQFRKIGKGHNPGILYKNELIGVLIEEIKYRLSKELFMDLHTIIFSLNQSPIAINVFETNISGNSSESFWRSIGIESRFCNFLKNQDACINPLHRNNLDLEYIYRLNVHDKYYSREVAHDIGDRFVEYLSVVGVKNAIEDKVTQISVWINKCMNSDLATWLKLKARVDNDLMYANRFVSEFKSRGFLNPDDYKVASSINIAQDAVDNLDKTVFSSKEMIEDIILVVNSNVEAQNSTASYRIQKITFYTNLFSAIAALVAIIISLLSEARIKSITAWFGSMQIIIYAIYFATVILFLWFAKSVIIGVHRIIRNYIIFHKNN